MIKLIQELEGVKVGEAWKCTNFSVKIVALTLEHGGITVAFVTDSGEVDYDELQWLKRSFKKTHEADGSELEPTKPVMERFELCEIFVDSCGYKRVMGSDGDTICSLSYVANLPDFAGFWFSENPSALQNSSIMYDNEEVKVIGGFDNHLEEGGKVCKAKYVAFIEEK